MKNEQHSRKNLETRLEDAKEKLSDERENFEKKNLEGKAQIADLLARLQADYPSQAALEADRKTIREAEELRGKAQEEAEKIIAEAENEIRNMKNKASEDTEELLKQGREKLKDLNEKIQYYNESLKQITRTIENNLS